MSILKESKKPSNNTEEDIEWEMGETIEKTAWVRSSISFIADLIKTVIISLAIILPVRYFVIQPFYVKGASMEPNFHENEYLIVNELVYRLKDPMRGDIIIFKNPRNQKEYFIKRILGLPNETIKIYDHKIQIYNSSHQDGIIIEEPYLSSDEITTGNEIIELKENQYYVMGDNRNKSLDSRNFGPIKKESIIGKVFLRGWPLDKVDLLKNHEYNL
ncbi:signal peptidase I [Patescibacteria group bacterium]